MTTSKGTIKGFENYESLNLLDFFKTAGCLTYCLGMGKWTEPFTYTELLTTLIEDAVVYEDGTIVKYSDYKDIDKYSEKLKELDKKKTRKIAANGGPYEKFLTRAVYFRPDSNGHFGFPKQFPYIKNYSSVGGTDNYSYFNQIWIEYPSESEIKSHGKTTYGRNQWLEKWEKKNWDKSECLWYSKCPWEYPIMKGLFAIPLPEQKDFFNSTGIISFEQKDLDKHTEKEKRGWARIKLRKPFWSSENNWGGFAKYHRSEIDFSVINQITQFKPFTYCLQPSLYQTFIDALYTISRKPIVKYDDLYVYESEEWESDEKDDDGNKVTKKRWEWNPVWWSDIFSGDGMIGGILSSKVLVFEPIVKTVYIGEGGVIYDAPEEERESSESNENEKDKKEDPYESLNIPQFDEEPWQVQGYKIYYWDEPSFDGVFPPLDDDKRWKKILGEKTCNQIKKLSNSRR